uniref:Protein DETOXIFICATION n=1 Tax=Chenopodium quinoa TaxID=63459 RepID=A0A803LMB3_CHEQI
MDDTPLLVNRGGDERPEVENGDYTAVQSISEAATVFWIETVKLWKIATPLVFNIVCLYATNSLTNIFVGHLGELELSAISISVSVINTFAFGFLLGMGSALETLCGQAFGAGQVHMLGVYMQRSWIILLLSCLVLMPIYIFAAPLLKLLGQDHDVANLAGKFAILTIPSLFSLAINFPTQKFLQAQSKDAWTGFTWAAFKDIWAFVRLSVASAVMLCLEIWYMMSIMLLAGHLPNAVITVGSLSICMNVNGLQFMIFIGMNAAVSVRVSNELGLQHPRATKYSVYVAVFQSLIIGLLCMVLILVTRDYFSIIYTDSKELQQAVSKLAWLLGVTMVLNSIQPVISGVAVGGGWQATVANVNLACYYVFGLPLGYLLGYVADFGVMGIWGGMIAGTVLQTLILLFILYRTNWTKEVEESSSRMQKWGGQDISTHKVGDDI